MNEIGPQIAKFEMMKALIDNQKNDVVSTAFSIEYSQSFEVQCYFKVSMQYKKVSMFSLLLMDTQSSVVINHKCGSVVTSVSLKKILYHVAFWPPFSKYVTVE